MAGVWFHDTFMQHRLCVRVFGPAPRRARSPLGQGVRVGPLERIARTRRRPCWGELVVKCQNLYIFA
jgi:hypothetical protein